MSGDSHTLHRLRLVGGSVPYSDGTYPETGANSSQSDALAIALQEFARILTTMGAKSMDIPGALRVAGTVSVQSIADLLPEFEAHLRSRVTSDLYADNNMRLIREAVEAQRWRSPADITARSVTAYLTAYARDHGPRSVNHARAAVCLFCSWCKRLDLIDKNPVLGIPKWRVPRRKSRICPTREQVARLILACNQDWRKKDRWLVRLTQATTGLRCGTIKALRWSMVRLEEGKYPRLLIPAHLMKNREEATIWLTSETAHWLRIARDERRPAPSDPVFLSVGKGKEFDRDLQAAGLPKRDQATGASFSPHSLRHFACMYLASGNALSDAERQAAMTHEARRMTTEVYHHGEHEVVAEKIFRLQPLLPLGFTPNPGRDPREKPRKPLDRRGENADTSPAKFGKHDERTLTNPVSTSPDDRTSHSGLGVHTLSGHLAAAGPPASLQLNGVEGSNPFTPIGCKNDPVLSGSARAEAIRALAVGVETLAALLREGAGHVRSDQQRTTESA
jgi:integrase